jgi:hypothetical protein
MMADSDRATPPDRRVPDDTSEFVQTGQASGTVRLRQGTAQAFSWTRLGVVLAIAALLAAAAYIAQTPLAAGDASASDDPDPSGTQVAESNVPPSPVASIASPEPSVTSAPEPSPTEDIEPTEAPTDAAEPTAYSDPSLATVGSIWTTEPMDGFAAQVEIVRACFNAPKDYAEVKFRVSWDGDVPVYVYGEFGDGDGEGGRGSQPATGSYDVNMIMTVRRFFPLYFDFFDDSVPSYPATPAPAELIARLDAPFSLDPQNACT